MSLLEKIKQDSITARKNRADCSAFLVTLYSEAAMVGKNKGTGESTDEEVITVCKKFKSGAEQIMKANIELCRNTDELEKCRAEIDLLNLYIPSQLGGDDLYLTVADIANEFDLSKKNMGKIMAAMKERFSGRYDGGEVSDILRSMLK